MLTLTQGEGLADSNTGRGACWITRAASRGGVNAAQPVLDIIKSGHPDFNAA